MSDVTPPPVVVSANAGLLDTLMAAGRLLVIILGAIPLLYTLLGKHDFAGLLAYFHGAEGATLIGAMSSLAAIAWALWKSHKRGAQVAAVAADVRVPDAVATLK